MRLVPVRTIRDHFAILLFHLFFFRQMNSFLSTFHTTFLSFDTDMLGRKEPQANPHKEQIAKHLRMADVFAREGRHEDALLEIENALRLDPKNYYARSFQERMKLQMQKTEEKALQRLKIETQDEEQKLQLVSELLRMAEHYIDSKEYQLALKEIVKVYTIDPQNSFAFAYSDLIEKRMIQDAAGEQVAIRVVPPSQPQPLAKPVATSTHAREGERASLTMYRELLREMWFDGKLSEEEVQELKKVQEMFGITQEEHSELEKQVHVDAYVEALRIAWRDGVVSKNESDMLQLMRERFNISMEEHMSAEARILWVKDTPRTKGTILVAEDERSLLLSVAAKLKKHGYDVKTAESVEQALDILEHVAPSLILSDLMFGQGKMTGLEFYQRVRANLQLKHTPFLMMSSISDEFVVRAGMRMGLDSFIAKPFDLELLLATIEGKVRG